MRFIDANVFLYALLKPKPNLPEEVLERKARAMKILRRIEDGEEVATSVVHLSEVANIIEAKVNLSTALAFIEELLTAGNVHILPVTPEDYLKATLVASDFLGPLVEPRADGLADHRSHRHARRESA